MKRSILIIYISLAFCSHALAQTRDVVVDKFAQFETGADKFYEYLKTNVKYPADAKKDSVSGFVYVEFIIGEDGAIISESVKIQKGLTPSCDAEALRVIRRAPKWKAGSAKTGAAIKQKISFPVEFIFP
ncbi:energy transducer TonB [Chryseolinea sp. H1M3-3]|uniref:energy transducer TonB n=1 Tax=Chryseolinea sp. H1M3-3 TaxID=3034144 RepID=UPI0023EC509E|nr:energy transducer TonB [Chryseolinea sp. H1M3-3]